MKTTTKAKASKNDRSARSEDTLLARALRSLRENPDRPAGLTVLQYLPVMFYGVEHGLSPDDVGVIEPEELRDWTRATLLFLVSFVVDLRSSAPQVSEDAAWALAQAGVTAEELMRAGTMERIEALATRIWS